MSDIIHLLPDSVANQIAAGEVIQRPASVIKELVENAIDADAQNIHVLVTDAGKTCIQIIDDGKGMSETDARLAVYLSCFVSAYKVKLFKHQSFLTQPGYLKSHFCQFGSIRTYVCFCLFKIHFCNISSRRLSITISFKS